MKKKHLFPIIYGFCLLIFSGCAKDVLDTTGSISGIIRDAINNSTLQGATVTLSTSARSTVTGADGYYQFVDVEQGNYTVSVTKADYTSDSKTVTVLIGQETPLDFSLYPANSALEVIPLSLDFGETDSQLHLNIMNTGQATMTWQITENIQWISCIPTSGTVLAGQTGSTVITVDRSGLAIGSYTNTLVVSSDDGGSQTVRLTMTVGASVGGLPQVAIIGVENITDAAATFLGTLTTVGTSQVTAHGFCWDTEPAPSLEKGTHIDFGQTNEPKDQFSYGVSNLTPNTTYYVRAYATNEEGTIYSSREERFTTTVTPQRPQVESGVATQITSSTASVSGNILILGHESGISQYGHCWSSEVREPTTGHSHTELGSTKQTGSYTSKLENLIPGTLYYVRAYARNQYGISYGQTIQFTSAVGEVRLNTRSVTDIIHNEATCGGNITDLQGNSVLEKGVCWSTSPNPTRANNHQTSADQTNSFSVRITGLSENTSYHVRAYVETVTGDTYYGQDIQFQTTHEIRLPQVSATSVSGLGVNSVTLRASVTNDGDGTISDAGFCYSISPNPSKDDNRKSCGASTGSFSAVLNNLNENTRYYVRAYVTNEKGTNYGDQTEFKTLEVTPPTLSDVKVSGITFRSALFTANVTSLGNGTLKRSGFCYATSHNPSLNDHLINCGTNTSLNGKTSNLTASTTYYVRAFAENEKGVTYSKELTITTNEQPEDTNIGINDYEDDAEW